MILFNFVFDTLPRSLAVSPGVKAQFRKDLRNKSAQTRKVVAVVETRPFSPGFASFSPVAHEDVDVLGRKPSAFEQVTHYASGGIGRKWEKFLAKTNNPSPRDAFPKTRVRLERDFTKSQMAWTANPATINKVACLVEFAHLPHKCRRHPYQPGLVTVLVVFVREARETRFPVELRRLDVELSTTASADCKLLVPNDV
jgi:hypothetical protein